MPACPPRGVRSRMASSWATIRCNVQSGDAVLMPTTRRTNRSAPPCGRARSSKLAATMPSAASRRTRAAQSLDRPGQGRLLVLSPHDVAPGLGGAHPLHGRQPDVELCQDAIEPGFVAAILHLADGRRIAGAQAWIAADTAALARRQQPALVRSAISAETV